MFLYYVKASKQILFFLLALTLFSLHNLYGSATVGVVDKDYPLGGTWRSSFGSARDDIHNELCERSMRLFMEKMYADPPEVNPEATNIALFKLNGIRADNGQVVTLLECDPQDLCFLSGGMVCSEVTIEGGKLKFNTMAIGERNALWARMKKPEGADTLAADIKSISEAAVEIDRILQKIKSINECILPYVEGYPVTNVRRCLFSKAAWTEVTSSSRPEDKRFAQYIKEAFDHLYDSEQSIMRCLDKYFEDHGSGLSGLSALELHLNTRFDMCRHCLSCMHARAKSPDYWRKHLGALPLRVFVSSNQEYRAQVLGLPDGNHYSMRFIGCDDHAHESFDDARDGGKEIIFQKAIPHDVQVRISSSLRSIAAAGLAAASASRSAATEAGVHDSSLGESSGGTGVSAGSGKPKGKSGKATA